VLDHIEATATAAPAGGAVGEFDFWRRREGSGNASWGLKLRNPTIYASEICVSSYDVPPRTTLL
jgi:hypothetical protein